MNVIKSEQNIHWKKWNQKKLKCPFATAAVKALTRAVQRIRSGKCAFMCSSHSRVSPDEESSDVWEGPGVRTGLERTKKTFVFHQPVKQEAPRLSSLVEKIGIFVFLDTPASHVPLVFGRGGGQDYIRVKKASVRLSDLYQRCRSAPQQTSRWCLKLVKWTLPLRALQHLQR